MKRKPTIAQKKAYRQLSFSKKRKFPLCTFLLIPLIGWCLLFVGNVVTLGGVPASIIGQFLTDTPSIAAFFSGDGHALHDRLEALGIEEKIKAYHRPHIPDEIQLDQYIHQVLYRWTGYIGNNYLVNSQGELVLKDSGERRLLREIQQNGR